MNSLWLTRSWILPIFLLASTAMAREQLGTVSVGELVLRPRFELTEPAEGKFSIGESTAAFKWDLDGRFGAVFRIGSKALINPTGRFLPLVTEELGLIEGYVEWLGVYGRLRMGLLPLEFGVEGEKSERDLQFPRSLIFRERVMGLRDLGLQYRIDHNGFFTSLALHNGEGGENKDGRLWYTAKWGWTDDRKFQAGLSGQTGTTKPVATSTSADTLANVDPSKEALWRTGGVFVEWSPSEWKLVLESYLGERQQEKEVEKYAVGHFDLMYDYSSRFGALLRYDAFDPHTALNGNLRQELGLGLRLSNEHRNSNLYLVGTKRLEEGSQFPNDRFDLIWSATP